MKRAIVLAALVVALLAVVAHAKALGGGFVYDDHRFVEQNEALDAVDVASYFGDASTASAAEGIQHDIYRPLRTLDFALSAALFGRDDPWGWHLASLLFHALASVLVYRLILPLVGGRWPAALGGAALFAVHPVAVECVAWISSRGDLLAVVLMLAALLVLERRGLLRTVVGVLLGAMACFAKESALVLPALLLLRDLALPVEDGGADHADASVARRLPLRTTALRTGLLLLVSIGVLVVRMQVIPDLQQVDEFPGGSRVAALRGMFAGLAWYARALLWPSGFPFDVHLVVPGRWSDPQVVLGVGLFLTLLGAGLWGLATGRRTLAFATLGALACLVPVSNVFVALKAVVAERFLYPVLVCVVAGAAWALTRWGTRGERIGLAAVAVLVLVLVPVSWGRAAAWADDLTLWETVLRERPGHMRAYEGLGHEYLRRGRIHQAEIAYRSYLDYNPADAKVMVRLGDAFGDAADGLRMREDRPGVETDVAARRRLARVAQLGLYRGALQTWDRIGLVRGRGSPAMVESVHRRRFQAALDLGDLREARHAADALLARVGIDPRDPAAVLADAPFELRGARLDLAVLALVRPVRRNLPRPQYDQWMAQRAGVLADVGIPPRLPDEEARRRLLPLYRAHAAAPEAGLKEGMRLAVLLEALGQTVAAERQWKALRERYPDAPLWKGRP